MTDGPNGDEPAAEGNHEPEEPTAGKCHKCGTKLEYGPPIGHYCPNKECEILDGPFPERVLLEWRAG